MIATPSPTDVPIVPQGNIDVALDQPFALSLGQTAQLPDNALSVTFDQITEDSRCPLDVMCAWSGVARIQLVIETPAQGAQTYAMGGATDQYGVVHPSQNDRVGPTSLWTDGYQIDLKSVTPYPAHASAQIAPSEYVVTLLITKADKPGGSPIPLPTAVVFPSDPEGIPMLCISEVVLTQLMAGATQDKPAQLTPPIAAASLTDEQVANGLCAALFDPSWHIAEATDLTGTWQDFLPTEAPYWLWDWQNSVPVAAQ